LRILLASDAASEGINLHYHCNQLFHFDIPWSLIRLTQRNGRIDRFGQKHTPYLHYLLTKSADESADQQVVDRLIEREQVVYKRLGDAGALLGLYDADAEDEFITKAVASGESVRVVIPDAPRTPPPSSLPPRTEDDESQAEGDAEQAEHEAEQPTAESIALPTAAIQAANSDEIDLFAIMDGEDLAQVKALDLLPTHGTDLDTELDINRLLAAIAPPKNHHPAGGHCGAAFPLQRRLRLGCHSSATARKASTRRPGGAHLEQGRRERSRPHHPARFLHELSGRVSA
jgi:hypothetical protein